VPRLCLRSNLEAADQLVALPKLVHRIGGNEVGRGDRRTADAVQNCRCRVSVEPASRPPDRSTHREGSEIPEPADVIEVKVRQEDVDVLDAVQEARDP
jgi:hypothetical protein